MNAPAKTVSTVKHFLDIADLDGATLRALIAEAIAPQTDAGRLAAGRRR